MELLLPAVRLNKRLSFCHRSGTGVTFMVPSEPEAQNTQIFKTPEKQQTEACEKIVPHLSYRVVLNEMNL